MALTLLPKSPRTTIILIVVLIGAALFVATSGGRAKRRGAPAPLTAATQQAARALADLAVPGPNAGAPAATIGAPDTTFGESPFLSLEDAGLGGGDSGPREDGDEGQELVEDDATPGGAGDDPPHRLQGTIVGDGRALALIDSHYFSAGQSVAGWKVVYVGPREARLEKAGRTLTLKVGRDS